MKLTRFLFFAAIALISITISGCNEDNRSVSYEGTWNIDTTATFVRYIYNQDVADLYPEALKYLSSHEKEIKEYICEPEQIVFSGAVVDFIYTSYDPDLVFSGTFIQYEIYATIYNRPFTSGITAATNGRKMELTYSHDYLMSILENMLTKKDPSYTIFENLIDRFDGVGVYFKEE
jgi:hypothetical protein